MSKRESNILIIAARYSNNLGDDIIYDIVSNACEMARGMQPMGLSISGKKSYNSDNKGMSLRKERKESIKKYLKSTPFFSIYVQKKGAANLKSNLEKLNWNEIDVVVFAGGQLFMDYFVNWIKIIVSFAESHKKKVIFNCCGMGKLSPSSIKLLKKVLESESVYKVTLRDGVSQFRTFFGIENAEQTMDPAINSIDVYGGREKVKGRVGVGIISYEMLRRNNVPVTQNEYIAFIKKTIAFLEAKNKKIMVFTNGAMDDQEFAKYALKSIGKENLLECRPIRPKELIDIIASCEYIMSFRLHSLIIAASYGIPTIGFVWDEKVRTFFETIGRGESAISLSGGLSFEKNQSKMESLIDMENYQISYMLPKSYDNLVELLKE